MSGARGTGAHQIRGAVREAWITERRDAGRHTAGRRTGRVTSFETAAVGRPALPASAPARVAPAPPARPVIEARSLSVLSEAGGTPVQALSDVDLTVRAGQFVSLIGPSGCGKTTLLRVIADLERATSGAITVTGLEPRAGRAPRGPAVRLRLPGAGPPALAHRARERHPAARDRGPATGRAAGARAGGASAGGARGLRGQVPLAALRRDAAAGLDRPRAQPHARPAADGRALRRPRRDHARPPQPAARRGAAAHRHHLRLRHPLDPGGGVPLHPRRGDEPAARARPGRDREPAPA